MCPETLHHWHQTALDRTVAAIYWAQHIEETDDE